ncbi:FAD-dependent oxidoreductase [Deinococcus sp. KNUC1210]|uniref:FAD-dependent oxidoreductase n=1 Tax=Deinococcus sp. KNUC1210 TaxID=2917691 RepID=UPI00351D7DF2
MRLNHEVLGVDARAATLSVLDRSSGRTVQEPYDRLLLATGVAPIRPDWLPDSLEGVHVLRDIPDAQGIEATLRGERSGRPSWGAAISGWRWPRR